MKDTVEERRIKKITSEVIGSKYPEFSPDIFRWCNETSASANLFRVIHCEEEEGISQNKLPSCVIFLLRKISKIHYLLKNVMRPWL